GMKNIHRLVEIGIDEDILNYTEPYESYKHRRLTIPAELTPQMSQLLGYFIGDGSLDKFSVEFKDGRKQVLEHYNSLLFGLFGISGRINKIKDKNCFGLKINSVSIRKLINETRKDMFSLISKSSNEHVSAFIRGFADAEGYVSKNRPVIKIAQKDEKLLRFIQMLLLRFGIDSYIKPAKRCLQLHIDGRHLIAFYNEIGLTAEDKLNLLERWVEHCENTHTRELYPFDRQSLWNMLKDCGLFPSKYMKPRSTDYRSVHKKDLIKIASALQNTKYSNVSEFLMKLINGDIMLKKIRRIKKIPNSGPLYDLSIPKNHNYIANGFVVHNSSYRMYLRKSKGNNRIARLIDSPSLPEGEAVFTVTEIGVGD
ncbi:MAG: LAGLIDADG family homing endonuclease, partial [Candidatus Aenigmarchaeota archaeon]|nr:LAGLIDADG family homing endonuclease [Candidatus Aenigmarchaeota archaeon]MDI6721985.1 LAGLIDADG family homing endonuclease [Candidatus Aenigmarchaeota archaeon]